MGYAIVFGPCYQCKQPFGYNPNHVPSLRINNVREPFCRTCIEYANVMRQLRGLESHPIHPEAYEPIDESELL